MAALVNITRYAPSSGVGGAQTVQFSADGVAAFTWTATAGNLLIAVPDGDATISGNFTDSAGAIWTLLTSAVNFNATYIYYKLAVGTETNVQFSLGATAVPVSCCVMEWSGMANPAATDGGTGNTANATSISTGSITTTNANDLLVVAFGADGTAGQSWSGLTAGYTIQQGPAVTAAGLGFMCATRVVSATGTYSASATAPGGISTGLDAVIGAFKATAGGAVIPPAGPWRGLMPLLAGPI